MSCLGREMDQIFLRRKHPYMKQKTHFGYRSPEIELIWVIKLTWNWLVLKCFEIQIFSQLKKQPLVPLSVPIHIHLLLVIA